VALLTRQCIEQIRLRADIVEVVGRVVKLTRAGREWKGLSPFTNEKTASFYVMPEKNAFYCFSSGQGGDVFRFVMLTEKLEFGETALVLAERFGVPLEYEDGSAPRGPSRSLKQALREIHNYAADFFHAALKSPREDAAEVRAYWEEKRGFPLSLAEEFLIGYAPPDGGKLKERLLKKGFEADALRQSGLFHAPDYRPDPRDWKHRFTGRLMVPIRDFSGQIIAFTARQLPQTPESDPAHAAKYVNSPTTPLFEKRQMLFNLDRARLAVEEQGRFTLVEGQLDALRCWETGIKAAVAPQGSAITTEQMMLLKRYSPRLDVVLDGDRAGRNAALKMLPLALGAELEVRFVVMPEGADPDDFLREKGADGWAALQTTAEDAMPFAAQALLPGGADASPRDKAAALRQMCEILASCESETARSAYLEDAIPALHLNRQAALADAAKFFSHRDRREASRQKAQTRPAPPPEPNVEYVEGEVVELPVDLPPERPTVIQFSKATISLAEEHEKPLLRTGRERVSQLTGPETDLLSLLLLDDHWGEEFLRACPGLADWAGTSLAGQLLARFLVLVESGEWEGAASLEAHLETDAERDLVYRLIARPISDKCAHRDIAAQRLHALHLQHLEREQCALRTALPSLPPEALEGHMRALAELKTSRLSAQPPVLHSPASA